MTQHWPKVVEKVFKPEIKQVMFTRCLACPSTFHPCYLGIFGEAQICFREYSPDPSQTPDPSRVVSEHFPWISQRHLNPSCSLSPYTPSISTSHTCTEQRRPGYSHTWPYWCGPPVLSAYLGLSSVPSLILFSNLSSHPSSSQILGWSF